MTLAEKHTRHNIAGQARQFKTDGLQSLPELEMIRDRAKVVIGIGKDLTANQKAERNAIAAGVIHDVLDRAAIHRAEIPFMTGNYAADQLDRYKGAKMIHQIGVRVESPFVPLEMYMATLLHRSIGEELAAQEQHITDGMGDARKTNVYLRFKHLVELHEEELERSQYIKSPLYRFLSAGVGTAVGVSNTILDAIPTLYRNTTGKQGNVDELMSLASSFYPTVVHLAMLHVNDFRNLRAALNMNPDAHEVFAVSRPDGKKWDIKLSDSAEFMLKTSEVWTYHEDVATGCPAMVNFGQGNGVQTIWQWHLAEAPKIYERMLAEPA